MRFWERSLWQLRALSQNLGCMGLGTGVAAGHLDVEMWCPQVALWQSFS